MLYKVLIYCIFAYNLDVDIMAYTEEELKKNLETQEYEYGFYTDIDAETFPVGLNEKIIRKISEKKIVT